MSVLIIASLLFAVVAVLAIPTSVLLCEIVFGRNLAYGEAKQGATASGLRAVVIIPAHNERLGIAGTVRAIAAQLGAGDRIVVVADNCDDETAILAREAGADVLERFDNTRRGKGFALAHGMDELRRRKPDVVIFVDADCSPSPGSIDILKTRAWETNCPIQAALIMEAPEGHETRYAVAGFAWRIKNILRPLGLARLGLPCQMMGTGMALRWDIAKTAQFASGNIVEDLELGLNLAADGHSPIFEPRAVFMSPFPVTSDGEIAQRRRWEGGSLAMLLERGVSILGKGIIHGNPSLLALGFDMLVPPLVTHGLLLVVLLALCSVAYFGAGIAAPLLLAVAVVAMFVLAIAVAWFKAGREILPVKLWFQLLPFVLKKMKIHNKLPDARATWVRADRATGEEEP
jgi:cellulose synthase/poly-beta-1,6-N-acetylglucosamine synthase-like glycosyltransferase